MSKLCYKTSNGEIKKYELKDSVNSSPKLAVKVDNNSTKYLRLKSGTKSGELCLRIGNQNFQVVTWDYTDSTYWKGLYPEPFRGMVGPKGDTSVGGCGVWVLVNEDGYPVVAFGRLGADRPDGRFIAYWRPNIAGTDDETKYPGNFTLTAEQLQHPGRLRPNVRMTTVPSNTRSVSEYNSLSVSGQRIVTTKDIGDYDSSKNNIIIADIVASLLNTSNYSGCMWCVNQFASDGGQSGYLRTYVYTYGAQSINKTGIYLQDPTKYPNETSAGGEWFRSIRGIQSDGLAYSGIWATYRPENQGSKWGPGRLSDSRYVYTVESGLTSINSYSIPYIQMYGLSDFGDSSSEDPDWAQRDFYIEFPYAWGEDTNPNDYFTFTPKQVLQALKAIAVNMQIAETNYGFTRGRNYDGLYIKPDYTNVSTENLDAISYVICDTNNSKPIFGVYGMWPIYDEDGIIKAAIFIASPILCNPTSSVGGVFGGQNNYRTLKFYSVIMDNDSTTDGAPLASSYSVNPVQVAMGYSPFAEFNGYHINNLSFTSASFNYTKALVKVLYKKDSTKAPYFSYWRDTYGTSVSRVLTYADIKEALLRENSFATTSGYVFSDLTTTNDNWTSKNNVINLTSTGANTYTANDPNNSGSYVSLAFVARGSHIGFSFEAYKPQNNNYLDMCWVAYVEYPEAGLLHKSPAEIITEWSNAKMASRYRDWETGYDLNYALNYKF